MKKYKIIALTIFAAQLCVSTYMPSKINNEKIKKYNSINLRDENKNIFDYMPEVTINNESRKVTFSDLKPYGEPIDYFEYVAKVKGIGTTSEEGKNWCRDNPYDVGDPDVDYYNCLPFEFGTENSNKIYEIPKANNKIIVLRLINFPITQADCLYGYIEDYNKSSIDQDSYFGMINNTNQNLDQIEDDSLENRYPFFDQLPYVYSPIPNYYDKINPFIVNFIGKIDFDFIMGSGDLDIEISTLLDEIDELGTFKVQPYIVDGYQYDNIMHDGDKKDVYVNIDDKLTQYQIIEQVKAQDVLGKELKIIVESSTYQNNKVGNYSIILKATDSYGLESKIELKVHVIDITAPKIVQNKDVRIPYGQKITEQELLAYFTITDNVGVISNKFILPTGFEFDKALSYGKYNLTLESKDSSSNTKRFSFVVDVYDGTAPVFSRKNGQISDPITVGYSESLNYDINNIINLFEAVDAIDGNCDIYLKSGRLKMIIGSHVLVLGAKDKVNNESTLSIVVTVVNDIPPIFILSDKIIQTSPARPLTVEQIKQVLENHILKNNFVKNIEFDASEYLNNTDVEGEYIVSYSYLNQNNEKVEDTFEIIVKGDSQAKNTRVSIWTKIRIFFEKLWNWICGRGFKANSEL